MISSVYNADEYAYAAAVLEDEDHGKVYVIKCYNILQFRG